VSYDPTFAYELAVIVQDGLRRMYAERESVYYYITIMNENYGHPDMPEDARDGILKGLYLFREAGGRAKKKRVQMMGSGTILREVIAAADLLEADFGVASDIWSAPSFNELAREGQDCLRWNRLHPEEKPKVSHVEQCLAGRSGPVIAATDYIKSYAEQIRALVPQAYLVLGTDGFGRSDTRKKLRKFFEVDRHFIAAAALKALADEGAVPASEVAKAIKAYGIDADKPNPRRS
jgi:pyruvate dehydrogenase E1 component